MFALFRIGIIQVAISQNSQIKLPLIRPPLRNLVGFKWVRGNMDS